MQNIPNPMQTTQAIILCIFVILGKQLESESSCSHEFEFELVASRERIDGSFGIAKFNL